MIGKAYREDVITIKRLLLALALITSLLLLASTVAQAEEVSFQDPAVEAQLRRHLEIFDRPLTYEDLLQVTFFRYDPYEIWSFKVLASSTRDDFDPYAHSLPQIQTLQDLAYCKNLTGFYISHQPVADLSPLSTLTAITSISLEDCPNITDLSPLAALTNLTAAGFTSIGTYDFDPVLGLPNLMTFYCGETQGSIDLSVLSQTSGLQFFTHRGSIPATDYSPLLRHPNLREVSLVGIDDDTLADFLQAFPGLVGLEVHHAPITNRAISGIASYRIAHLTLVGCPAISDLTPLSGNDSLYILRINGSNVTDISPLEGLQSELHSLDLRDNPIEDISPLGRMRKVHNLLISAHEPYYTLADVQALMPETSVADGTVESTPASIRENMRIALEERLPLTCIPLADGGFLLSGIAGEEIGASVSSHFVNYLELDETELMNTRPLYGYVAAYDASGTEQWVYQLPAGVPYQRLLAQPIEGGQILCTVQRYLHGDQFSMWGSITDAFLLDSAGHFVDPLHWFESVIPPEQQGWTRMLPGGILSMTPIATESPMPYTPTLTLHDYQGQVLWQTTLTALKDYFIQSVLPVQDGYVGNAVHLSAMGTMKPDTDAGAFKLDLEGNLLWKESLMKGTLISAFTLGQDGRLLVSASRYEHGEGGGLTTYAAFLNTYDAKGVLESSIDYEAYYIMEVRDIVQGDDGNLYLLGYRAFPAEGGGIGGGYPVLVKADADGTPLGYLRLQGNGNVFFRDTLIKGPDGLYVVGPLMERDGKDRWYILPIQDDLFVQDW